MIVFSGNILNDAFTEIVLWEDHRVSILRNIETPLTRAALAEFNNQVPPNATYASVLSWFMERGYSLLGGVDPETKLLLLYGYILTWRQTVFAPEVYNG